MRSPTCTRAAMAASSAMIVEDSVMDLGGLSSDAELPESPSWRVAGWGRKAIRAQAKARSVPGSHPSGDIARRRYPRFHARAVTPRLQQFDRQRRRLAAADAQRRAAALLALVAQ